MIKLYDKMLFCHTLDRDNLLAYPDCAPDLGKDDPAWADAIRARMEIEIYPQRMGDYQAKCLDSYYPNSYSNYLLTLYDNVEL